MLKNNKRGFTLVELLAVIVILGVITLIAVTSVIPRMNSARKNAFLDDAKVYFKASDEIDLYNNNTTKCLDISEVNGEYVSKNDDSYSGALYVYPNGDTKLYLTNGKYYVITTGDITSNDIKENKPANFIASCSDGFKNATGTYITLDDITDSPLKSIELLGNSIQNGTPSVANPVDIEVVSGNKEVVIVGKNLFSESKSQTITTSKVFNIPLSAGTYTISFDFVSTTAESIPSYMQISYVLSDGTTNYNPVTISNGRGERTFTLPKDAIRFAIYANTTYNTSLGLNTIIDNIQLEKGSNVTSFEPYQSQTYQISLGDISLRKVGDYADRIYFNNGKWYLDQNIRHLELKISEMNNSETYPGWHSDLTTPVKEDFPNKNIQLSTISTVVNSMNVVVSINTNGGNRVVFLSRTGLSQSEWKAQYPNTILKFDYSMPNPITTEITNQTLINQLNSLKKARCYQGVTNITSNNLPFNINASCYK